jgi:predicted Zn-dependent peptidase
MDRLGLQRSAGAHAYHLRVDATLLADRLGDALPLLVNLVRRPALPDDAVDPVRNLCLQSIDSLNDEPQHLAMLLVRGRHMPRPFNRHGYGDPAVIQAADGDALRQAWSERSVPEGSIIAAAGAVDPEALSNRLNELLADWRGAASPDPAPQPSPRGCLHVRQETAQVHIGLAYDAPAEPHEDSMLERLATSVLSGSTSGRLFSEVRQKRSLCYSVGASYRAGRDRGLVSVYAGTTPERAQETLDVCLAELDRLSRGATREEYERAKVGLKSRLVMQGESTPARASAIGGDHFRLGRLRTLDEIADAIDAVSFDDLNAYLARRPIEAQTIVTVGPSPLAAPDGLAVEHCDIADALSPVAAA